MQLNFAGCNFWEVFEILPSAKLAFLILKNNFLNQNLVEMLWVFKISISVGIEYKNLLLRPCRVNRSQCFKNKLFQLTDIVFQFFEVLVYKDDEHSRIGNSTALFVTNQKSIKNLWDVIVSLLSNDQMSLHVFAFFL